MYSITVNVNGIPTTKSFEKYYDLIRFVATTKPADEDFVSLSMGDVADDGRIEATVIEGMDGLCNYAFQVADQMEQNEKELEEMIAFFNELGEEEAEEEDEEEEIEEE